MKILAIDDSKTILLLLRNALGKMGHEVVTVTDPEKAADVFMQEKPDLIILDVIMSEKMDGYQCARNIRRISDDEEWVPIIFLSSLVDDKNIAEGIDAGGDDYLTKPFSDVTLSAKIKAMQRISDMQHQLTRFTTLLKKSNKKLYELTYVDGLTNIANRRAFNKGLQKEWNRVCRIGVSNKFFSLIMIDIDKFKFFNDTYGHQAGDECLQQISQALAARVRRVTEMLCRYGGEEFVIILPYHTKKEAMEMAEALRKGVEVLAIPNKRSDFKVVTISLGVSSVQAEELCDPLQVLNAADLALYEAKEKGRNRVAFKAPTKK